MHILYQNKVIVKFEDLHTLFSDRRDKLIDMFLAKHGLKVDNTICPSCGVVARKVQKGVLLCKCEDEEILLNKRGIYSSSKHMA